MPDPVGEEGTNRRAPSYGCGLMTWPLCRVPNKKYLVNSTLPSIWLSCDVCRGWHSAKPLPSVFLILFFSQLQMFSRRISRDLPRGTGRATPWMPRPARMVLLIERRGDCARLSRVSALMSNLRSLLGVETAVSRHLEVEQLY